MGQWLLDEDIGGAPWVERHLRRGHEADSLEDGLEAGAPGKTVDRITDRGGVTALGAAQVVVAELVADFAAQVAKGNGGGGGDDDAQAHLHHGDENRCWEGSVTKHHRHPVEPSAGSRDTCCMDASPCKKLGPFEFALCVGAGQGEG